MKKYKMYKVEPKVKCLSKSCYLTTTPEAAKLVLDRLNAGEANVETFFANRYGTAFAFPTWVVEEDIGPKSNEWGDIHP